MPWVETVSARWIPPDNSRPWKPRDGERLVVPTLAGDLIYRVRLEPTVSGESVVMLNPVMQAPVKAGVVCKTCGSGNLVRFGMYGGIQRYMCRSCNRTFMDNGALPGMKTPPEAIGAAVSMFYGGLSIADVSRNLDQIFDLRPSKSTIYEWIIRYTKAVTKVAVKERPRVGDVWVADETVLKIGGDNVWFWDIIDEDTRYLLATHMSLSRTAGDATTLMKRAVKVAGRLPRVVVTDKLNSYLSAVENMGGAATRHRQSGPFKVEGSTRAIERFHGTLKDRTKVMRGMANRESAKLVMEGWLVHYNHFRGHEGLGGETPGRAARVVLPFRNWAEVVLRRGQ